MRRGEVFLVTDRNRVVAELRPPGPQTAAPTDELAWRLERLADAGDVQPARLRKQDWSWRPAGAGLAAGTARDLLDAVREERGA